MAYRNHPTTQQVLSFIETFIDTHDYSPSIREIADGCYVSVGSVVRHLDWLEFAGEIIRTPGQARSIRRLENPPSTD